MSNSRRNFLQKLGATSALLTASTSFASADTIEERIIQIEKRFGSNDKVRIGVIGMGIIGHIDLVCALKVPGVELAGVCDLYEGRLVRAKEKFGNEIFVTRDYRELIARKDIDAVLVCTSDHWHDHISIAAMKAGKHVYCEKPMVHHINEGHAVIQTQKETGKVFQVGSQTASSAITAEIKKYFKEGIIGDLSFVEIFTDRNSANGAWQYTVPTDASAATTNWDKYLGDAPKRPFEANRFFRWRNYKEYGTGVAGDLVIHQLTELHSVTDSFGPKKIFSMGAINYWKDGRDAYDLVNSMFVYEKSETHPAFQFITRVNLADGAGGGSRSRYIGTEGVIEMVGGGFKINHFKRPIAPSIGGYDALETFSKAEQEESLKAYNAKYTEADKKLNKFDEIVFKVPQGYDSRLDHMFNFFGGIRDSKPIYEDATFGLRAAGPALACNISVEKQSAIKWDPIKMKVVG
ncbi:MAG: Gfo/Idh/MocA family oxidoreductase [Bacteroidota bacterium]